MLKDSSDFFVCVVALVYNIVVSRVFKLFRQLARSKRLELLVASLLVLFLTSVDFIQLSDLLDEHRGRFCLQRIVSALLFVEDRALRAVFENMLRICVARIYFLRVVCRFQVVLVCDGELVVVVVVEQRRMHLRGLKLDHFNQHLLVRGDRRLPENFFSRQEVDQVLNRRVKLPEHLLQLVVLIDQFEVSARVNWVSPEAFNRNRTVSSLLPKLVSLEQRRAVHFDLGDNALFLLHCQQCVSLFLWHEVMQQEVPVLDLSRHLLDECLDQQVQVVREIDLVEVGQGHETVSFVAGFRAAIEVAFVVLRTADHASRRPHTG